MLKFIGRLFSKNKNEETVNEAVNPLSDNQQSVSIIPITPKDNYEIIKNLLKLGNQALGEQNFQEAENKYKEALSYNPEYLEARINLAWVLNIKTPQTQENLELSKEHLLKAIEINENNIDSHFILAQVYQKLQDTESSIVSYINTLNLKPDFEQARNALYVLAVQTKNLNIVLNFLNEELLKNPQRVQTYFDLGNFYKEVENYPLAIDSYNKYLTYDNNSAQTYNNLGAVYFKSKNPELAVENYRKAIELGDLDLKIDSTNQLLFTMNYIPEVSLSDYSEEAKKYGDLLNQKYQKYTSWKERSEKLKIGFLSGDLKYHPVSYFLLNTLKNFDKKKYEFIAYSTSTIEDTMSNELRKYFTQWNRINIQDPQECARQINEDGIDILIDLAGHSHGHFAKNLHVFAMKPAPLQASWLGYFNSTGVKEIDYILLDQYSIKPEEYQFMTEKVINLPETRLNYFPPEDNVHYPTVTPAIQNGYITFGCYQSLLKINKEVLKAWSEILTKVPNSKLRIQEKSLKNEYVRQEFLNELKTFGLEDKVILVEGVAHQEYLKSYSEVDIILDTFPFTGGTTTCEALWMGIPTLTIEGDTIIGRQTTSFLKELKMNEWVAENKEQYIQKAVDLSQDLTQLNNIRQNLRKEFLESSICDARNFALDFEEVLEEMWLNK